MIFKHHENVTFERSEHSETSYIENMSDEQLKDFCNNALRTLLLLKTRVHIMCVLIVLVC